MRLSVQPAAVTIGTQQTTAGCLMSSLTMTRTTRTDDLQYVTLRSLLCSGNRANRQLTGHRICSGPLRSCSLFKRVHLLLYAVVAFSLLFARWTSRNGQLPIRKWVTDFQCSLAGSSLLLLPDRSQIDQIRNNNVHHSND